MYEDFKLNFCMIKVQFSGTVSVMILNVGMIDNIGGGFLLCEHLFQY